MIVNYESATALLRCLASLVDQDVTQIIVVDNGPATAPSLLRREGIPTLCSVFPPVISGFAGGANFGARLARGQLLLFLNPDIRLRSGAVRAVAEAFVDERVGVAGPPLCIGASGAATAVAARRLRDPAIQ